MPITTLPTTAPSGDLQRARQALNEDVVGDRLDPARASSPSILRQREARLEEADERGQRPHEREVGEGEHGQGFLRLERRLLMLSAVVVSSA